MKNILHLTIEFIATLICTLWVLVAIYGITLIFDTWSSPDIPQEDIAISIPYFTNDLLFCVGAILGAIGIYWGLVNRVRKKVIKSLIAFRVLLIIGIASASLVIYKDIPFSGDEALIYLPLLLPIYVAINYMRYFNNAYNKSLNNGTPQSGAP